jgi:hypothetical protein
LLREVERSKTSSFGPVVVAVVPAAVRCTSRLVELPLEPVVLELTLPAERVTLWVTEFPFEPVAVPLRAWAWPDKSNRALRAAMATTAACFTRRLRRARVGMVFIAGFLLVESMG